MTRESASIRYIRYRTSTEYSSSTLALFRFVRRARYGYRYSTVAGTVQSPSCLHADLEYCTVCTMYYVPFVQTVLCETGRLHGSGPRRASGASPELLFLDLHLPTRDDAPLGGPLPWRRSERTLGNGQCLWARITGQGTACLLPCFLACLPG
jgi:hypothetical protein